MCRTAALFSFAAALPLLTAADSAPSTPSPASVAVASSHDDRMDWWRDARFGLFIHWGLYAIPAGEWNGATHHGEWIMETAQIPVEEYEKFLDRFNPVKFNADEWVSIAKDAGMKYIVITSKHHDGFALFDSAVSDYDVMATPFQRDIMKELAEACDRQGLRMCWYHSIMDWHHPDYLPRRSWEKRSADGANYDRFIEYLHAQVTELLTKYGDIGVMWFDGEWENTWSHEHGKPLYDLCRNLQPSVIVNNRVDKGRAGMAGMTTDAKYAGDFGTPEQEIPATGFPGVDWETCMTMNGHWGYNRADLNYKSTTTLIQMLCDIASKGGNFLLNVGPTAEGVFPPESIERLRAIGQWMKVNGDAIYGTTASPFAHLDWGRCTVKQQADGSTVLYLHVFEWPHDGRLVVPGLGNEVEGAFVMGRLADAVPFERVDSDVVISLTGSPSHEACTVVRLHVKGAPIVYETPVIEAASDIFVRDLEVTIRSKSSELEVRYTIDGSTPESRSPRYESPFRISATTTVKARAFHRGKAVSGVAERTFTSAEPMPGVAALPGGLALSPGLRCSVYSGTWDSIPEFTALQLAAREVARTVSLPTGPSREREARVFEGFLDIPADDLYLFSLTSDDGSRLFINGQTVVDNDGLHGAQEKRGRIALRKGLHGIVVHYFNKTGGAELELRWARGTGRFETIPNECFRHAR